MKKICVAYICHETERLGGAALSLSNLIHSVREEVEPIVIVRKGGNDAVYNHFARQGFECLVIPFELNTTIPTCLKTIVKYIPKYIRYHARQAFGLHKACRLLRHRNVSIVHSNSSVFTFGYLLAKRLDARHVWHIREFQDLDFHVRPFFGWKHLRRLIYESDAVIAITRSVYDHWALDNATNAIVLWDAVRSVRDLCDITPKEKFFLFCAATLSDKKGAGFALEAFAQSQLADKGYQLFYLGECPSAYREQLERAIADYGITKAVSFKGFMHDTKDLFTRATAFLMCSQHEGLGRVTIEALFFGCPVIARNSGGTPEFIQHGKNGFLFKDETECARLMQYVTTHPISAITQAAHQTAIHHFSEETYGQRITRLYMEVLDKKK